MSLEIKQVLSDLDSMNKEYNFSAENQNNVILILLISELRKIQDVLKNNG